MAESPRVNIPDFCSKHRFLLVTQAGYERTDPWQALIIATQVALFQAMTVDKRIQKLVRGDVTKVSEFGCFACQKPDEFVHIVQVAKSHDLGRVKALGEKWVADANRKKK